MSYLYLPQKPTPGYEGLAESLQQIDGLGQVQNGSPLAEVNRAIRAAKAQMKVHTERYEKLAAGAGRTNDGTAARTEVRKFWEWSSEMAFLLHEGQAHRPDLN